MYCTSLSDGRHFKGALCKHCLRCKAIEFGGITINKKHHWVINMPNMLYDNPAIEIWPIVKAVNVVTKGTYPSLVNPLVIFNWWTADLFISRFHGWEFLSDHELIYTAHLRLNSHGAFQSFKQRDFIIKWVDYINSWMASLCKQCWHISLLITNKHKEKLIFFTVNRGHSGKETRVVTYTCWYSNGYSSLPTRISAGVGDHPCPQSLFPHYDLYWLQNY